MTNRLETTEALKAALVASEERRTSNPDITSNPNPAGGDGDNGDESSRTNSSDNPPEVTLPADLTVETLLADDTIGPKLKAYADGEHANQMRGKTDEIRKEVRDAELPRIEQEIVGRVQQRIVGEVFSELDDDVNIQELLAAHPEFEKAYNAIKANGIPTSSLSDSNGAVQRQATVLAYATRIRSLNDLIAKSDLPAESQEALKPEVYAAKHPTDGDKAMDEWQADSMQALIAHQAGQLKDSEWEAFKQDKLASEEYGLPKGQVRGSKVEPQPDIMENSGRDLLSRALSK